MASRPATVFGEVVDQALRFSEYAEAPAPAPAAYAEAPAEPLFVVEPLKAAESVRREGQDKLSTMMRRASSTSYEDR